MTNANHVIHLSRWWNPAVEDQCNDRIYRIGQNKDVVVHTLTALHPIYGDESYDVFLKNILERKRKTARGVLVPMGEIDPAEFTKLHVKSTTEFDDNWDQADRLNPIQFERWIGEYFSSKGYNVRHTPITGDFKVDLVIRRSSKSAIIALVQIKHKMHPRDYFSLSKIYYKKMQEQRVVYKAPGAQFLIISNAKSATSSQRKEVMSHKFELILRDELSSLLEKMAI